jgi:hypothetical protein
MGFYPQKSQVSRFRIFPGKMVGAVRFELTTSCTRNKRASQATLRPDNRKENLAGTARKCNTDLVKNR